MTLENKRNKELSLSLSIAAYLNTLDDYMFTRGEDVKGIHDCMKMWQKLHNHYFYGKDTNTIKDIDISDVETTECPCCSCELFVRKNNECKDISLCKMPKNPHKGFFVI